jgi:hypothetical protein
MQESALAAVRKKPHRFEKLKLIKIVTDTHSQVGSGDFVCYILAAKDPWAYHVCFR